MRQRLRTTWAWNQLERLGGRGGKKNERRVSRGFARSFQLRVRGDAGDVKSPPSAFNRRSPHWNHPLKPRNVLIRGFCFVLFAKKCHNPARLNITPPSSSSPSGLSSDVDGRRRATKLSNAPRARHFCLFSTNANRHTSTPATPPRWTVWPYLPWNQSLQASHSIMNWVTS